MPLKETKRSKKLIIAIVVAVIAVTLLAMKYNRYVQLKEAATRHYDTIEQVLSDVEQLGGHLVHCQYGVCRDRLTGKRIEVDEPRTGNFILYPPGTDVPEEVIEHQSEEIKRLSLDHDKHL